MTAPHLETPPGTQAAIALDQVYEYADTRALVSLVDEAAALVRTRGEAAFDEFRVAGSRWHEGETYIFVIDPDGNMLVHADPALEGKNQLELRDVDGKPVVRGLISAAAAVPDKHQGWYHYRWPVPGGLLPRWKSSFVRLVETPLHKRFIVGSGMYNDRMERAFLVDLVNNAVATVEARGEAAFPLLRDPTGPFLVKGTYVFVLDYDGLEIVNPAFPNLEGRTWLDLVDTQGTFVNRDFIRLVKTQGSGWHDYMWPKPGESVSTRKSAFVRGAKIGDRTLIVGCGAYLADAPKEAEPAAKITVPELMTLVREAAAVVQERGDAAFAEFRKEGSKWFRDDIYFFAFTLDGVRSFHAADPAIEGEDAKATKDILGRPYVGMMLDAAASAAGEGWVHYMYPEPQSLFPIWKSSFVKRVTLPSGKQHILGCGIYNMQMDKAFVEDVVSRAAALVAEKGVQAFEALRDKRGPFVFMDTYVFVQTPDGIELVNPGLPSLEGRNLLDVEDLDGRKVIREEIEAAMTKGSAWIDMNWYKPGDNTPARKQAFVRKVEAAGKTYIVGSGIYVE